MNADRNKIWGIVGTVVFHGLLLALFLMFFLKTEKPLPGEEGVLVNVGYMEEGTGEVQKEQPMQEKQQPPKQKQPEEKVEPEPEQKEDVMTQEAQEAPSVPKEKEKKEEKEKEPEEEQPEPEKEPVEEEPEKKTEEEPEPEEEKPDVNEKALYKGKSDAEEGQDEGETGEPGDQGSQLGSENADNHEGEGGMGEGISFSLKGRSAKHLPKPEYNSMDEGKVVVRIYVDKYGNVKRAEAGARGTTVTDLRLRKLAQKAAMRAKFSQDPEAPEMQKGTITYNFIRMQN